MLLLTSLMPGGTGQEHSSSAFMSNHARQTQQSVFFSISARGYQSPSLLSTRFGPQSAQRMSAGSLAASNTHRCSKNISYQCLSRVGGRGMILASLVVTQESLGFRNSHLWQSEDWEPQFLGLASAAQQKCWPQAEPKP